MTGNTYLMEEGTGRIFHIGAGRKWKHAEILGTASGIGMSDSDWDCALCGKNNLHKLNRCKVIGYDVPVKKYLTGVNGRLHATIIDN